MKKHLATLSLLLLAASSTAAPSSAVPAAPRGEALRGTLVYRQEVKGTATTTTIVTDGVTHAATLATEKRYVDAEGRRYVQRRGQDAVPLTDVLPMMTARAVGDRVIAGRAARCLVFAAGPEPGIRNPASDTIEACQFSSSTAVPFALLGRIVPADVDAIFAAHGLGGVPASIALRHGDDVQWSVTATQLDVAATPPAIDAFMTFKPGMLSSHPLACAERQKLGSRLAQSLYIFEEAHRGEFDTYAMTLPDVDALREKAGDLFAIRIVEAAASHFVAEIVGTGVQEGDRWRIDENGRKQVSKAPCR